MKVLELIKGVLPNYISLSTFKRKPVPGFFISKQDDEDKPRRTFNPLGDFERAFPTPQN